LQSIQQEVLQKNFKVIEQAYPNLHDFMLGKTDDVAIKQEEPIDLSISYAQLPVKTPKMLYFDQVASETVSQLRMDISILYDFGFVDFEMNKALLMKYKNVEQVAGILLEGRLSESVVNSVYGHN